MFSMRLGEGIELTQDNYYKLFINYGKWRIKKKKNLLCVICGGTGSGKSLAGLFLAEELQKLTLPDIPFTARNVCFKGSEFLNCVTGENALPSKSVVLFDEGGVSMNSRRSMTNINILINDVFQTFRSKQYCVIITVPDFSFVDSAVRKLLHVFMSTKSIDFKKKRNCLQVQVMQNNVKMGKIYYHTMRVNMPDKPSVKVPHIFVGLPTQPLWDAYEKKKLIYQTELYEKNLRMIKGDENLGELTDQQRMAYNLNQKGLKQQEIADTLGVSAPYVTNMLKACDKKGYKTSKFYAKDNFKKNDI
jgi:Trp operon repressor